MRPAEERFWAKVNKTDGCWLWTAACTRTGYGHFWNGTKMQQAHRFSIELATGFVTADHVDHICHTPACVRPSHLRRVTRKQNMENRHGANVTNKSGFRGVSPCNIPGMWQATVCHNGKQFHLGYFTDPEAAGEAAKAKRLELFTHNEIDRAA